MFQNNFKKAWPALASFLLALAMSSTAWADPSVFQAAGPNAGSIQSTVDAFRTQLGTLNPNTPGSVGSGRREINWDGVPNNLAAPNNMPANFFNSNSPRGAVFTTNGTGFQVSANAGIAPVRFDNINPTYSAEFSTFSAQRLFTAVGSNLLDVVFFVPGTDVPATVSGFGSVFTDVDLSDSTSLAFYDINDQLLYSSFVPNSPGNGSLSFLGVFFNNGEGVHRVRITSGNTALGPNDGNGKDVVAMDDFIYGEPVKAAPVPEPASMFLLGSGLAGLGAALRKRRQMKQE